MQYKSPESAIFIHKLVDLHLKSIVCSKGWDTPQSENVLKTSVVIMAGGVLLLLKATFPTPDSLYLS